MSSTYFTDEEKERLLSLTVRGTGKALGESLADVVAKRAACDGQICSLHGLKPIQSIREIFWFQ